MLPITASQVPDLVVAHTDYLLGRRYGEFMTKYISVSGMRARVFERASSLQEAERTASGAYWCDNERAILSRARLYHVSESMIEVAKMASKKWPDDEIWETGTCPAPVGFIMFEQPIVMLDIWGAPMAFRAASWEVIPAEMRLTEDRNTDLTAFSFYTDRDDLERQYASGGGHGIKRGSLMLETGEIVDWLGELGVLVLSHISSIAVGERLGAPMIRINDTNAPVHNNMTIDPDGPEVSAHGDLATPMLEEQENLLRLMFTIFQLMDQTVARVEVQDNRQKAKKFAKRKIQTDSKVTIIRLRREASQGQHDEKTGRFLLFRSVTDCHWRRQHYGPGREQVKRIFIQPYVRGDASLPFRTKPKVTTLSR